MAKKKRKRLVVISDFHCGHVVGLTPPDWHEKPPASPGKGRKRRRGRTRFSAAQIEMWQQYLSWRDMLCPIDALVLNGDAVEGKGKRSGGTEMITTDRTEQTDMAAECVDAWNAPKIIMTYGTPSHTGEDEDWEDVVADKVGAGKIGGHEWIDINGVVFDFKHKIGSSGIPHGRHTAIARENLWNLLWAEREESPRADVIVRSHVHYHNGAFGTDWLGMTTPALQGKGSKYGVRQCGGVVDWGLVYFDVEPDGRYTWEALFVKIAAQRAKTIKL